MCIPSRFTVPRGSLVACNALQVVEMGGGGSPHKGMKQLIVPELGSYKLNCKAL